MVVMVPVRHGVDRPPATRLGTLPPTLGSTALNVVTVSWYVSAETRAGQGEGGSLQAYDLQDVMRNIQASYIKQIITAYKNVHLSKYIS